MADMITVKEAAELWDLTPRRVSVLCKEGRIDGAVLTGHRWLIPAGTAKPADQRVKTGAYTKAKDVLSPSVSRIIATRSPTITTWIRRF